MMRFWLPAILTLLAIIVAVVAAQLYLKEPLYLEYLNWSANPPISVALGGLLLLIIALMVALRLIAFFILLPRNWATWRSGRAEKRHKQLMQDAMRLSAYQDWRDLLKVLTEVARTDTVAAWQAAQTADLLGNHTARDKLLNRAATSDNAVIAAVAKATICRHKKQLTEADSILKTAGAPNGPTLLAETYYTVSKERQDWSAALAAALALRDSMPRLWAADADKAMLESFQQMKKAADAKDFWRTQVPANDKKRPLLIAAYLRTLVRVGDEKTARDDLTQALKQYPQDDAILEVVVAVGDKAHYEKAFRENEERADSNQVRILRILAPLAEQLGLSGKARRYYQMLNVLEPHPQYRKALSTLPEA